MTPRGPLHQRVEPPWGSMHWEVTKVGLLKNPKWSYERGSRDSPGSYAPESCDSLVSYVPGSHDSHTKFLQIVENYVTYNLQKYHIDSIKIKAKLIPNAEEFSKNKENLC